MFQMLEKLDIFGVPIKLKTLKQEEAFRTSQSGIITLVIVTLSLIYFCYVIVLWGTGQLMPKVTLSQSMVDYAIYEWNDSEISFTLYDLSSETNPFTKENNIIMPVLLPIAGVFANQDPQFIFSTNSTDDGHKSHINIEKGKLVLKTIVDGGESLIQYLLFFTPCREDWMEKQGGTCADSQTIIDYFYSDHGLIFINIQLEQYNFTMGQFDKIQKTSFFAFSPFNPLYSQIVLQQQNTIIDSGILLNNNKEYNTIRDYQINNQAVTNTFLGKLIRYKDNQTSDFSSFCGFLLRLDNIKTYEQIVMPKLGEVLAQIGSIVNLIMLLKILANIINVTLLENSTLHQIIEIYYPEMKQVYIDKNLFGQIKRVQYKGQAIKLDLFLNKYNELKHIAKQKFTFNNLIYELSRMQLILIKQFGLETVKNLQIPEEELNFNEKENFKQHQSQEIINLAIVSPEESPQVAHYQRFTLFNYDY